jgi:hypothetical protein
MDIQKEIRRLKAENKALKKENALQTAVIETIEEVNEILGHDEQGKKLLWTTGFPDNLGSETAARIQAVLKKNPNFLAGKKDSLALSVATAKE